MNVKRLLFRIGLGLVLAVLFVLAVVALWRYLASGRTETPPTEENMSPATSTAPLVKNEAAFVRIDRADATASPGGTWSVGISSNAWSSCLADLYAPDEKVSVFANPNEAQAAATGNGKFTWTWNVPTDAAKGTWTVRILCGTYENLASRDVSLEVN